jgi:DnaJ-class molecular chaperone
MKKIIKFVGIIALLAVIGFSLAGCEEDEPCGTCFGTGDCQKCDGIGSYPTGLFDQKTACSLCKGTGRCPPCDGTGIKKKGAPPLWG